jgi:hypothetical protein
MPLTKIDYSNTIIYKLCCKDLSITEVYVGHTTDFRRRKNSHKTKCNNEKNIEYNFKVYKFIRDNGGWDNWDMIEIERFEAIDGNDAKKKERYWIETLKSSLNCRIECRTNKEWIVDNKNKVLKIKKKYRDNNKEKIAEKDKEYRKNNKEKIAEKLKEYRKNNKETLLQKNKEYYEKNKDKIFEKVKCECGCEISKQHLNRHQKSKKHIDLMSMKSGQK